MIADLKEADAIAAGASEAATGLIRMTVPQAFGSGWIAPALNRFAHENPEILFEIDVTDRLVDLDAEPYDLALRIDDLSDPRSNEEILFQVRYRLCASPAFWRKHGTPNVPSELVGLPALAFKTHQGTKAWHFRDAKLKLTKIPIAPRYVANTGNVLIDAAKADLGVVLEPDFLCAEALQGGTLVEALAGYDSFRRFAKIAFPANRPPPLRVKKLIKAMRLETRAFAAC